MLFNALETPSLDPTPIFELFRGSYGSELLTAAITHFDIFTLLEKTPLSFEHLQEKLGLEERPAVVLITALRAFGLLEVDNCDRLCLSNMASEHLVPGKQFDVSTYVGLAAESPGVKEMVERLRTNRPPGVAEKEHGAAFIYRDGIESAMEQEKSARHLTLSLAGRAKNVAPFLAERVSLCSEKLLLDIGGGSGIYSIALLQKNLGLRSIVFDRPEVLKVAEEMARDYGVSDRLECLSGDMFRDDLPDADVVLLSNILHDWDVAECRLLVSRCAGVLPKGGRLLIHDVFLNDALDGPLPIALYSAALFSLTEGRAYSAAEYRAWLAAAGLDSGDIIPTLIHCGVISGVKAGI